MNLRHLRENQLPIALINRINVAHRLDPPHCIACLFQHRQLLFKSGQSFWRGLCKVGAIWYS